MTTMMLRIAAEARRRAAGEIAAAGGGGVGARWLSSAAAAARKGRLQGKIALITGGASGLGRATAHEFIQEGAVVILADINSDLGLQTAHELGPKARFVHCDVAVEDSVAAAVDAAAAAGRGRLDVMFNSAGIAGSLSGTSELAGLDLGEFDAVMRVNVRGTLAGIKHATRVMAPAGSGSILCMASISALLGGLGSYPYSVSKLAIAGVVRAAAAELSRHGVRVNCISPHAVATPMVVEQFSQMLRAAGGSADVDVAEVIRGLGELRGAACEAADVARAAVYLASDDAKYVSGHNLVVDGGFTTYKRMNLPFLKQ